MEVISVESNAFRQIIKRLDHIYNLVESDIDYKAMQQILDTNDLCTELKISKSTASRLRKACKVSYFKDGRRVLYYKADVKKYMDEHSTQSNGAATCSIQ